MTPDEIHKELEELEGRLERLRVKYEQYFTGIEKAVPWVQRKDVDRRFQLLHREQLRSSGQRFRFNSLVQRFTTYQTYWGRILRRIEEGTLKRDVLRAQRMGTAVPKKATDRSRLEAIADAAAAEAEESTRHAGRGDAEEMPEDMFSRDEAPDRAPNDGFVDFGFSSPPPAPAGDAPARPGRPAIPMPSMPPPGEAPRRPMISAFAGLRGGAVPRPSVGPLAGAGDRPSAPPPARPAATQEDGAVRALYDRFIAARQTTGETSEVRFEQVAKQVKETLPKLAEKYQGADVTFDVAIKDGRAILRPVVTVKKR